MGVCIFYLFFAHISEVASHLSKCLTSLLLVIALRCKSKCRFRFEDVLFLRKIVVKYIALDRNNNCGLHSFSAVIGEATTFFFSSELPFLSNGEWYCHVSLEPMHIFLDSSFVNVSFP